MRSSEEKITEVVDYCGPVKTSHKGFYLSIFEKFMKRGQGGSYIVMKSPTRVPNDISIINIGYKYNYRQVL